jgi:galactose mutarotase-like enzyme
MIILENNDLKAKINIKGAELQSLYHKQYQIEYMWNGDPKFWGKSSPVLFPIVGTLKDDSYLYNNKSYSLSRHGFARDMIFEAKQESADKAEFTLQSNEETLVNYPFNFVFKIHYELHASSINVTYEVINPSQAPIYFSVGGHPAFAVPLVEGTRYEDYFLEFDKAETAGRWPIKGSLIDTSPNDFLLNEKHLPLNKDLFYKDAIVLKNLKSDRISIRSKTTPRGLDFYFEGFPFLGIWAAKDAPFVCIEPWCGIADSVDHNQKLEEKEGIISLAPSSAWKKQWKVECL